MLSNLKFMRMNILKMRHLKNYPKHMKSTSRRLVNFAINYLSEIGRLSVSKENLIFIYFIF